MYIHRCTDGDQLKRKAFNIQGYVTRQPPGQGLFFYAINSLPLKYMMVLNDLSMLDFRYMLRRKQKDKCSQRKTTKRGLTVFNGRTLEHI